MSWNTYYPRPQLRRDSFLSLNGEWELNDGIINVPFPPESRLSGYNGPIKKRLEYTRMFTLPEGFTKPGERVILHFGAVDQVAELFINNKWAPPHEGGYLPFSMDITDLLDEGENELFVRAIDPLSHEYPWGKQKKKRGGMWYTPVSGIWQSVWLESVPENHIESLKITPDLTGITICTDKACVVEIPGLEPVTIPADMPRRIDIPSPHLWTPDDPYLYNITLIAGSDVVKSYFALRTIEIKDRKVLLNGKPIFMNGVLDQGYFEDGIYLPESPDGYEADILRMKELGINLLRKHIKIEPEAFYYACDRLGMLVMQDMVNCGGYNFILDTALPTIGLKRRPDSLRIKKARFFTRHAQDTVDHLYNHPCIIAYTIFNEGWGQFDADMHYELLKNQDPTRLYDATSGWFWQKKSDFDSEHVYFRTKKLRCGVRPLFLSECGGFARPIKGHMFNENAKYGYGTAETQDGLMDKIEDMWEKMVFPAIPEGLCGVVYTQLSDVEDEINGLYTYDRQVCKVDPQRMRVIAERAHKLYEGCD